jgi:hypothetical protein
MTKEKGEDKVRKYVRLDLSSKFWKMFLVVLAAFLTFAGPTYVVYAFIFILKIDYFISMISGFVLFMAGLLLVRYVINNRIVAQ